MAAQIEIYEQMSVISTQMVEAAHASDWNRLIGLEKSVAALRETLALHDGNPADVSMADADRKAGLIQHILENDAEIRRHTEPWMEHLRRFLGDASRKHQIDRAYGAL